MKTPEFSAKGGPASGWKKLILSIIFVVAAGTFLFLEEAPAVVSDGSSKNWQLVVLSAKTDTALETATSNLAEYLKQHPDIHFGDMAYTLSQGRKIFNHRRILVCQTLDDVINKLNSREEVFTQIEEAKERPVVFMFSGQGSQYVNMGRDLVLNFPSIRNAFEETDQVFSKNGNRSLSSTVFPIPVFNDEDKKKQKSALTDTEYAQPAIGTLSIAMYEILKRAGFSPDHIAARINSWSFRNRRAV